MQALYLCLGCMKNLEGTNPGIRVCPFCGYPLSNPPFSEDEMPPGSILEGHYILGRSLGRGGYGITYIGWDALLGRKIAIKEFFPRSVASRDRQTGRVGALNLYFKEAYKKGRDAFLEEARALASLDNVKQINNVYHVISANGTGYIILEFIEGTTLKNIVLEKGPFSTERAVKMIWDILTGLIPVHAQGRVHRDIAPDNIMLSVKQEIRIIDFGAAISVVADHTKEYDVIFKPGYAPIEQYDGSTNQGPWTDVYAVGATFYYLITGVRPCSSKERSKGKSIIWPWDMENIEVPRSLQNVLETSMEMNARDRYRDAREFRLALKEALEKPEAPGWIEVMGIICTFLISLIIAAILTVLILEILLN